jgi:hypothetical protein
MCLLFFNFVHLFLNITISKFVALFIFLQNNKSPQHIHEYIHIMKKKSCFSFIRLDLYVLSQFIARLGPNKSQANHNDLSSIKLLKIIFSRFAF